MPMELTTMVIGQMTNNMVLEWSHGQMVPSMKVIMSMEKKKAKASLLLLMEASMKESSSKMKYAGMENIRGQMASNMKASGAIIKCMVKELLFGKIRKNTKVNS